MMTESLPEGSPYHIPVMIQEVTDLLITDPNGIYLDGTVGLGGHATQLLNALSDSGRLIGLDRDEQAVAISKQRLSTSRSFSCFHASYHIFSDILHAKGIPAVTGILLDLGLSSLQLDSPVRGFGFQTNGALDMRFDTSSGKTAAEWIAATSDKQLADILYTYGEDRRARRIAKTIKEMDRMATVADLNEAVRRCTPPKNRYKTLARVFQALRIAVNDELDRLQSFLKHFIDHLLPQGRIIILSYHSLEDRLVKQSFKTLSIAKTLTILTKKPLRPSVREQTENTRSRSARLRAGERI